jgi:CRP-like cAMP-binding protein
MDVSHARNIIANYAKERFGSFLELGDVFVVRRASGRGWRGDLYCPLKTGPIHACSVYISEDGKLLDECTNESVVESLSSVYGSREASPGSRSPNTMPSDLAGMFESDPESSRFGFAAESETSVRGTIDSLRTSGERQNLLRARELLPRLLSKPTGRGFVLLELGEVELALGENALALNYLEAAAREFADIADIGALELVAELALSIQGPDHFAKSSVKSLLDKSRTRLKPLEREEQAPIFSGLGPSEIEAIASISHSTIAKHGEVVMKEGKPATIACVVKSGVLSIRIEEKEGVQRVVRCCYPGDFVGEGSVLGARDAACSATVQADCLTSLWVFAGSDLRNLCRMYPSIYRRVESARAWHRLDSFLSVNEYTQALDVSVRDKLLGCIVGMRRVPKGEVLCVAGQKPNVAYLLAEGKAEQVRADGSVHTFGSDSFICLRDTLHQLCSETTVTVTEPSVLIVFDSIRLREMAAESSSEVVAAMERMG